jgi:hypothetical protein
MRVERKTPANGVVGLDWEGGPLPVGGLSLGGGGGVRLLTKGGSFF